MTGTVSFTVELYKELKETRFLLHIKDLRFCVPLKLDTIQIEKKFLALGGEETYRFRFEYALFLKELADITPEVSSCVIFDHKDAEIEGQDLVVKKKEGAIVRCTCQLAD